MLQNKTRIRSLASIIVLCVIGVAGALISSPWSGGTYWAPPRTSHTSSAPARWTVSDIYIENHYQPLLLVLDNKLVVLGSDDFEQPKSHVIAFDATNGQVAWRIAYDGSTINSSDKNIIVGGMGEVLALDSSNGKSLWTTKVPLRAVTRIVVDDGKLYIVGAGSNNWYILDATNGNILSEREGDVPGLNEPPSLGDTVFRTTGERNVVAINRSSGEILWQNNAEKISNLVTTSSYIYVVSLDGNILKLNPVTGVAESITKFSPAPLHLSSGDDAGFPYPFYVAVDTLANSLFVYLGDSSQLFAYSLAD